MSGLARPLTTVSKDEILATFSSRFLNMSNWTAAEIPFEAAWKMMKALKRPDETPSGRRGLEIRRILPRI